MCHFQETICFLKGLTEISKSLAKNVMIRLEMPRARYVQRIYNNMGKLYRVIRKGDLVWVEGRSEMNRIIKLFSLVFLENQISLKLRFIEIKVIEIYEIIAYTKRYMQLIVIL